MRQFNLIIIFLSCSFLGLTQNIDSVLSVPQTLELTISTPQPRLKEKFQISLDINYLRAHIFKSAIGKIQLADEFGIQDNDKMILNVNALKKGKHEIGPLQFTVNGTKYSTNKITYEVVDQLPNVDKGLWFRKVNTSDTTFCIIIEQRIPAKNKKTITAENSFTLTTEPEDNQIAKFKTSYSIPGLSGGDGNSYMDFGSIYDANGDLKQFLVGYSIYYFIILDKAIKIKITKDKFENLPTDYKFEEIVVQ